MPRRLLTCHHEAGHALVRWYFGYGTDRAVVQPVEAFLAGKRIRDRRGRLVSCEGLVAGSDICGWPFGPLKIDGSAEDQAECDRIRAVSRDIELINCYAGFYSEAAYTRRSIGGCMLAGGSGDIKRSRTILDAWGLTGHERDAVCLTAEARASALIRSSQGSAAIKAIANALLVRGQLSGAQIAGLCRRAYGNRECAFGAWMNQWPPKLNQIRTGYIPERPVSAAA